MHPKRKNVFVVEWKVTVVRLWDKIQISNFDSTYHACIMIAMVIITSAAKCDERENYRYYNQHRLPVVSKIHHTSQSLEISSCYYFDSLAAIVDGVEQWSRLLPILTRFEKSKSCENTRNGKESGSHCTIPCKCSLNSLHT